jgi:hypothetical protein
LWLLAKIVGRVRSKVSDFGTQGRVGLSAENAASELGTPHPRDFSQLT